MRNSGFLVGEAADELLTGHERSLRGGVIHQRFGVNFFVVSLQPPTYGTRLYNKGANVD